MCVSQLVGTRIKIMSSPTIWESASRPLFVRSVWLETTNPGRGHQRHFILDYATSQQHKPPKTAVSPQRRRRGSLRKTFSSDLSDWDDACRISESSDDLILVGSSKVNIQQPEASQSKLKPLPKFCKKTRLPLFLSTKLHSCGSYHIRRVNDIRERQSRRSSLQDIQSTFSNTTSNPDERLAERVLNWLDLAGETDILRMQEDKKGEDFTPSKAVKFPRTRTANTKLESHKPQAQRTRSFDNSGASNEAKRKTTGSHFSNYQKLNESVKQVTIIFNKERAPPRLLNPKRNIDFYLQNAEASTRAKLSQPFASARPFKGVDGKLGQCSGHTAASAKQKLLKSAEGPSKSILPKRLHDEVPCSSLQDAKKQLHIFLPSLPKKDSVSATDLGPGADDMTSTLSTSFSELCKI